MRWSDNDAEAIHLARLNETMPLGGIVRVIMKDGILVEGAVRGCYVGNNGNEGYSWRYRGSITIQCLNESIHEFDLLDVARFEDVTKERGALYEEAGLIMFVDNLL
ncbi:hypothetical protein [Sphingobium sp. D43FB]|uniref:hypothetical protein n=1 Tax=Sphingobium sp. D43FB TaxID=2017595 RepID=UPI000BB579E6|nr:hypothetical protein [Sphingobium sp. D43FB]PBN43880.1 hypothetical protein SxD43FB_09170 [Sphingobium sp. D43FB]